VVLPGIKNYVVVSQAAIISKNVHSEKFGILMSVDALKTNAQPQSRAPKIKHLI
jgi:hypothetical protein